LQPPAGISPPRLSSGSSPQAQQRSRPKKKKKKEYEECPIKNGSGLVKVTVNELGQWHLHVPINVVPVGENQAETSPSIAHLPIGDLSGVASIDPGTRTFATVYDTDGNLTEWGAGAMGSSRQLHSNPITNPRQHNCSLVTNSGCLETTLSPQRPLGSSRV
jgi:YD repeat-containing protein